jgi:pimeloyl-ACP methyl ester carboxylesterase
VLLARAADRGHELHWTCSAAQAAAKVSACSRTCLPTPPSGPKPNPTRCRGGRSKRTPASEHDRRRDVPRNDDVPTSYDGRHPRDQLEHHRVNAPTLPELAAFDAGASRFHIPFFVFQGAADLATPTECARAFATKVQPPIAQFATIPETGHLVAFTRPDEFLRLLVERVLPVCEPHHP